MKKLTIFIICFSCLFWAAVWHFEFDLKLESLDWLLTKLAGMAVIFIALVFDLLSQKEKSKGEKIFSICILSFWMGYYSYQSISRYDRNIRQDKFGLVFNDTRRRLGVPEIPANWKIGTRRNGSVSWLSTDTIIGHQSKDVYLDSSFKVDLEIDDYKLKSIDSVSRNISITTKYARGKAKDSIFYYFNPGDSTRLISRQRADSIFAAEKIKKDYQR